MEKAIELDDRARYYESRKRKRGRRDEMAVPLGRLVAVAAAPGNVGAAGDECTACRAFAAYE